ncbi:MAG: endonuclease/exonuclease/phosphatase family protein [Desulfurivibrionaceae bacterium]|nr:endonuclease/exonuclease/phosphatase family protein [Desulfurivibrionaceae bacterium]
MNFRVLSYNIHRAIGLDRRFRPERIAGILAHHNADIVLLQEVDVGVPRSRKLNLAKELAESTGYPHVAVGLNVKLKTGMYGNATLSRFPIKKERNIGLAIEKRKSRGCLYTELEIPRENEPGLPLPVFNLHLGLSFRERPRQVGLLVHTKEFVKLKEHSPCIVGGDFNDWWSRLAPIFTEILDFACATNKSGGYQDAIFTYPSFSPANGLDKIFHRGDLKLLGCKRCRLNASKVASDHLPIIADFQLG